MLFRIICRTVYPPLLILALTINQPGLYWDISFTGIYFKCFFTSVPEHIGYLTANWIGTRHWTALDVGNPSWNIIFLFLHRFIEIAMYHCQVYFSAVGKQNLLPFLKFSVVLKDNNFDSMCTRFFRILKSEHSRKVPSNDVKIIKEVTINGLWQRNWYKQNNWKKTYYVSIIKRKLIPN